MKKIALALIEVYQKHISPYKGFSCAYRVATGEVGCSGYGKKVISRFGITKGYALLKRRFKCCKYCSEQLKKELEKKQITRHIPHHMRHQAGFCDVPDCGGCDVPNCDLPSPDCGSCDIPDCDPGIKLPHCGGFTIGDFCDFASCCGDFNPNCGATSSRLTDEKQIKKVQDKIDKNQIGKKPVSLEKNDEGEEDNEIKD
jgi:putative component of membrane protein insertase Oxa1/YidC/SpoIIIJ protein YidD